MKGLIGSFLIEDDQLTTEGCFDNDPKNKDPLLRSHVSIPSLLRDRTLNYDNHRRILLQGGPSSIITSLLFDLAISLASNEPCHRSCHRCRSSTGMDGRCCCVRNACRNVDDDAPSHGTSITVFRPTTANVVPDDDDNDDLNAFPLRCRPENDRNNKTMTDSERTRNDCWDIEKKTSIFRHAFHRIQIIYVSSIQEIIQYLLTIATLPILHQPLGGIFIDQLDHICCTMQQSDNNHHHHDTTTSMAIQMSQTVAILMDTISFLEKTHNCSPMVVVSLVGDNHKARSLSHSTINHHLSSLFPWCTSFWSPLHLTLVSSTTTTLRHDNNNNDTNTDPNETITGQFHLRVNNGHDTKVIAVLRVIKNQEKETQIVWTAGNVDDK